jgi:hypothetical protein
MRISAVGFEDEGAGAIIWGATLAAFVAARASNSSLLSACASPFACVSILCCASAFFVSTCRTASFRRSAS